MPRRHDPTAPRPRHPRQGRGAGRAPRGGTLASLHLFAEVAITGVLIAIGSLPLITLVPSLAAGTAHLRRHLTGRETTLRRFATEWWAATRALWPLGLATVALAVLLIGDWQLATSATIPGATLVAATVALVATGAVAVVLRAAATWSDPDGEPAPATTTRHTLSIATQRTTDDLTGSALLATAALMTAVLIWMLTPLALIAGGLLTLATTAVETRRRTVRAGASGRTVDGAISG